MARYYKQDNPQKRIMSRRALLRGLGGVAVSLPLLEIMLETAPALAQTPPLRYLVLFGGQSMGSDDDAVHNLFVPDTVGPNYDLKLATQPFADFNVQTEITIVSNLDIPAAMGGAIPAGGRADDFHINNMGPLLTGVRSTDHDKGGPTSDQIMADIIGNDTVHKSVSWQVQAAWYLSVSAPYGRDILSVKSDGSGGLIEIPGTVSPQQAFDSIFYNFQDPGADPAQVAAQDFAWRQRKSVVDLVKRRAERLVQKLGGADQQRIERHLDEIRDLEKRIGAIPPTPGGACELPPAPTDPPLGGNQPDGSYNQNVGYSGEEERARAFMDLIHMAFTCNLTRVGAILVTMAQSHLNFFQLTGQATDLHEIGHHGVPGGTTAVATAQAWHMKHFAYLVDKFRSTPEDTGTLLDNSAIVWLWEGGHGYDSGADKQNSSHSTQNMTCAIAGGAGGLRRGEHVVAPSGTRHPANVLITAMRAAGYTGNTLGEVTGDIPGLYA